MEEEQVGETLEARKLGKIGPSNVLWWQQMDQKKGEKTFQWLHPSIETWACGVAKEWRMVVDRQSDRPTAKGQMAMDGYGKSMPLFPPPHFLSLYSQYLIRLAYKCL